MKLTGPEFIALHDALSDAFLDYDDLSLMLMRTGRDLADAAERGPKRTVIMKLIRYSETRDSVGELIDAARAANAENRQLAEVAAAIGLEPAGVPVSEAASGRALADVSGHLERLVDPGRGIADFGSYAIKIQELLRRICAVELGDKAGTGFLIGPETVLTNHHVVADAINGDFDPADIVLRFDYRRLRDGKTTNAGVELGLAGEWLVDAEPHSTADVATYDPNSLPAENELDYAVLRTSEKVGLQPPSGPVDRQRGWIEPLGHTYGFPIDSFLMIVQHPCNDPISWDSSEDAVLRVNPNQTRVHYRANTMPGSSGSPVLNPGLELVALHHAGEPGSPDHFKPCHQQTTQAEYNEGIPIATIQANLESKGLSWVFGSEAP